jgi:DICT domain-containing protein
MNALTYAIEDECLAHARRPVLLGCFQSVGSFRRVGRRWRELGRGAERAVVLSDFDRTLAEGVPEQAALPPDSPLLNEWGLVCVDPDLSVVLVGWERPRASTALPRVFEAVVSIEPDVVRDAALRYAHAAGQAGLPETDRLAPGGPSSEADPHRTMSLLRRFATYSDR